MFIETLVLQMLKSFRVLQRTFICLSSQATFTNNLITSFFGLETCLVRRTADVETPEQISDLKFQLIGFPVGFIN